VIKSNENERISQREISQETGFSLGTVNKIISELVGKEYIDEKIKITDKGLKSLEPYKVKRAIFLAAGFGSRLVPLTLNTPKPLIRVHGKRMIETLLDAVVKAGIPEIIIVRGYLGEQFEVLLHKYPNIKFIDNPLYNEANNISSAYQIKDYFSNAYVLESDLILSNDKLIREYEYSSNFLGIPVETTDDWCVETKNGIIVNEKIGGMNCHQLIGISYYNKEDGQKLKLDMEEVFNSPGGKEKYWEQVQLVEKRENYKIYVRECNFEDIVEIDTFNELKKIDKTYDV
jgi:CTP:phosphocholine cytidylyltransferase-like protein